MKRIALVTYRGKPGMVPPDDDLLIEPLSVHGITAEQVIWDDETADWTIYDAAVIRSTWDYHSRKDKFHAWLDALERDGVRMFNPYVALRWNSDKIYLRELANHGARVIPTVWGENQSLAATLQARQWEKALLKPRFGASAEGIEVITAADATDEHMISPGYFMQPFMPQVAHGEYSLIFYRGQYAYTVLKRPAEGNIFVQEEHGGVLSLVTPPHSMIHQAQAIIETAARILNIAVKDLLYVRVDGLRDEDDLLLMELELIEPALYFYMEETAPQQFAEAMAQALV